ncbi:putative toxin-antitoxin system toxin component, PIN family [Fibrella arboris]|uniref:putative toxin-antitoxin system toxin component, PIN family n=1 Tax=Fibrella arboris TaxID=3242486 RepID=UPI003520ED04
MDTNDFISALIGKSHREKLAIVLENPAIERFADDTLLTEIREVASRLKFQKYVSPETVDLFIATLTPRLSVIKSTTLVTDSPDPDDNYLLALAIDAEADYLVTGDKKHLLALSPYRGVPIIRLQMLIDSL